MTPSPRKFFLGPIFNAESIGAIGSVVSRLFSALFGRQSYQLFGLLDFFGVPPSTPNFFTNKAILGSKNHYLGPFFDGESIGELSFDLSRFYFAHFVSPAFKFLPAAFSHKHIIQL